MPNLCGRNRFPEDTFTLPPGLPSLEEEQSTFLKIAKSLGRQESTPTPSNETNLSESRRASTTPGMDSIREFEEEGSKDDCGEEGECADVILEPDETGSKEGSKASTPVQ